MARHCSTEIQEDRRIPRCWAAASLLPLALLAGCSYSLRPGLQLAGESFDIGAARAITAGLSEAELLAALGSPHARAVDGDREIWRYYSAYSERACVVRLLGIIPVSRPGRFTAEARFVIMGGRVAEPRVEEHRGIREPALRWQPNQASADGARRFAPGAAADPQIR